MKKKEMSKLFLSGITMAQAFVTLKLRVRPDEAGERPVRIGHEAHASRSMFALRRNAIGLT